MQKKLIVLAVSGALGVPLAAFAQATSTVYGRANMGFDRYSATGSSVANGDMKGRFRVFDSGSRLGFRGTEDLGGGMQAYFVLESGVNWDNGVSAAGIGVGQGGQVNTSSGQFATRDSFAGIKAAFGEVSFGRQSIFWANGLNAQSGANYINASADGILTGLQIIAPPVTRQSNVVYYTSPRMAGLDVAVAYSPHTQEGATYTGTNQAKPYIWGLGVKYRLAGLYVQFDHATLKNNGFSQGSDNTGDKIGVSYGYMPGSRAAFIVQRLKNKLITAGVAGVTAAGDTLTNTMMGINWEHSIGSLQLLAGYFRSGEIKGASVAGAAGAGADTKTNAYHAGVKHNFSKRTGVYASYNVIANKPLAAADFTGGAYTSGPIGAANLGADPKVIAVGMMHNF